MCYGVAATLGLSASAFADSTFSSGILSQANMITILQNSDNPIGVQLASMLRGNSSMPVSASICDKNTQNINGVKYCWELVGPTSANTSAASNSLGNSYNRGSVICVSMTATNITSVATESDVINQLFKVTHNSGTSKMEAMNYSINGYGASATKTNSGVVVGGACRVQLSGGDVSNN